MTNGNGQEHVALAPRASAESGSTRRVPAAPARGPASEWWIGLGAPGGHQFRRQGRAEGSDGGTHAGSESPWSSYPVTLSERGHIARWRVAGGMPWAGRRIDW